jgi:hypothetical protein
VTRFYRYVGVLVLCLAAGHAAAADQPLTDDEASRAVAATRELSPVIAANQDAWAAWAKERTEPLPHSDDPCVIPAEAKGIPGYSDMLDIIHNQGFSDGEQYCRVSLRLYTACMANQMAAEDPDWREKIINREQHAANARQQMEASLKELEADESLTPDQKQQIREKMAQMLVQMEGIKDNPMLAAMEKVTPEDMQTAKPHCDDLLQANQKPQPAPEPQPAK